MNLRPPRPERGALPGCATLRHARHKQVRKSGIVLGQRLISADATDRKRTGPGLFTPATRVENPGRTERERTDYRAENIEKNGRKIGLARPKRSGYVPPRLEAAPMRGGLSALRIVGAWPSGKAADFGSAMRRFESYRPSQLFHDNLYQGPAGFRSAPGSAVAI